MIDATATYGLSTTNDAAQNGDALSMAIREAGGQTVFISEGVYPMRPLTIKTDHTSLMLAPGAILQVEPSARVPAILDIRANHVTVDGGQFDGSSIVGNSSIMAIRIYGSCNDIAIRNCIVRNASTGIGSYNGANCEDWVIEGCTIESTVKSHGICLHGHPRDNKSIRRVRVVLNTISNTTGNGIWIGNGFEDVTVVGNQIHDSGRMGIEVWHNPTGGFVIAENIVERCANMGISIARTPHTTCSGNIISKPTSYGIEIADSRAVMLANNHIADVLPRVGGVKPAGITLNLQGDSSLGDIAITGGVISGCHAGINLCGGGHLRDHIAITGVCIHDCVVGIHNVGRIGERDGGGMVEHVAITGCVIRADAVGIGNSPHGGVMCSGVIASNNIQSGQEGISLFRATDMLVSGNRIAGDDGSIGILLRDNPQEVEPIHNLLVTDNLITGFETPVRTQDIYKSQIQGV